MCGISCIVTLQQPGTGHGKRETLTNGVNGIHAKGTADREELANELDESLEMIKHRGPDSRGHWISDDMRVGPLFIADCISHERFTNTKVQHSATSA